MVSDILSEEDYNNKRGDYGFILRVLLVFFIINNQSASWHLYNNLALLISTIILFVILLFYYRRYRSKPQRKIKDKLKLFLVFVWWCIILCILIFYIFFEELNSIQTSRSISLIQDFILFLLCLMYIFGADYERLTRKRISNILIILIGLMSAFSFLIELLKWYDVELLNYAITSVFLIWASAFFLSE